LLQDEGAKKRQYTKCIQEPTWSQRYIKEKIQHFITGFSKKHATHADLPTHRNILHLFTSSASLRFASRSSKHASISALNNAAMTERRGP